MAKNKRRKHSEEDEHIDESWLIPYADILTLLLALFIVLFAGRAEDKSKMEAMMDSFYKAFNTVSVFDTNSGGQKPSNNGFNDDQKDSDKKPDSEKEEDQTGIDPTSTDEKNLQEFMSNLQQYISDNQLDAEIYLTDIGEGIQITLKDSIIFDSGSDMLLPNFTPILDNIASMLQTIDNSIIIEGHTDNKPIHTAQFPSNWELSGSRALSVVRYLQTKNIAPDRLRYTGYGEYMPLHPNDTPEHREANRRVNFIVLRK